MWSPHNLLMSSTLMVSIIIVASSASWFSLWLGLEINTLAFLSIISTNNKETTESSMIYFLPQALASSTFLFASLSNTLTNSPHTHKMLTSLILLAMIMKLGAAPLHQWFPKVALKLTMPFNSILMTIQKMPPMIILSQISPPPTILNMAIFTSALFGPLGGLSQTNIKTILAFSSISHLAWMLASMSFNNTFWQMYLLIYSLILLSILLTLNKKKITSTNQITFLNHQHPTKTLLTLLFLSLGGMPPLTGFLPKWTIIMNHPSLLTLLFLISSTLLNLFFYLRICYSTLFIFTPSPSLHLPMSPTSHIPTFILSLFSFSMLLSMLLVLNNT
nr:NADH dehydrogenase subunit 2 [Charinus ferreus]